MSVRLMPLFRIRRTHLSITTSVTPLTTILGVDSRRESPELHHLLTANQNPLTPLLPLVLPPPQPHPLALLTLSLRASSDPRAVGLPPHHSKALPTPLCTAHQAAWPHQLHRAHPAAWPHPLHPAHQLLAFPHLSDWQVIRQQLELCFNNFL